MNLSSYFATQPRGTKLALSKRLNVSQTIVSQWALGTKRPTADNAINIERETDGAVTVEEIRPDVDWKTIRPTRDHHHG